MRLGERLRRIEREGRLDPTVARMKKLARRLPSGKPRDLLHGVPLGHPLHPITVHLPIGSWTAAVVLDLLPGNHSRSAHALVNTGLLATLPAVVSGLADWSQQHERQQRVGVVHAALNATGTALFAASSFARYREQGTKAKALALCGIGAVGIGGYLGAHISYYRAGGANSADALLDLTPRDWHDLGPLEGFPDGGLGGADADGVPVVVARRGRSVSAFLGLCTHMGAPLEQGELVDGCVRCPWHGSEFSLEGGTVAHGPATASLEVLETSTADGRLWVRHPGT
ncbi:DUF2231 domain-containing protein [Nocardiopsis kunsanensis]|uniref:Rieske domain-containing protein n=1 Tax=Nocardiopsis kunsanensis TaxID=141693 RepID=A0A918XFV0_9ACTN|nr:DUF2231 domain-containing protein [Nocardiopsis kunsanensis]GHD29854.1 hypothetical protein GCM10007147_31140 [Nocardiopsis kunsanensis]